MKTNSISQEVIYSIGCELEVLLLSLILGLVIAFVLPKIFTFLIDVRKLNIQTKKEKLEFDKDLSDLKKQYSERIEKFSSKENQLTLLENSLKKDRENFEKEKTLFEKEKKSNRALIEDLKFLIERIKDKEKRDELQDELKRIVSEEINDKTKTNTHE